MAFYLHLDNNYINNQIILEYKKLALFDNEIYVDPEYFQRTVNNDLTISHIIYTLNRYFLSIDSDIIAAKEKEWNWQCFIPYTIDIIHIRKVKGTIFNLY
jgi:hypothetical protein